MDFTNLDPEVVNLAKAIRNTEGNNFNATNPDAGGWSVGAYQWHGKDEASARQHFQAEASQFGLDPHDFSAVNQDKVAYAKLKNWRDKGYHAGEIAAMWNGAHLENGRPVANNPKYIEKVQSYLHSQPGFNPTPYSGENPAVKLPQPAPANKAEGALTEDMPQFSGAPGTQALKQTGYQVGQNTVGAGKSLLNTADAVSVGGQGVLNLLTGGLIKKLSGNKAPVASLAPNITHPTNHAQTAGYIGGNIGQLAGTVETGAPELAQKAGGILPKLASTAKGAAKFAAKTAAGGLIIEQLLKRSKVGQTLAKGLLEGLLGK